jgi:uncharacterized protein (TIGR03086 family)
VDLEDLGAAQTAMSELLAGLGPDDWSRPTPCEEWDVAGVAVHLIMGERAFTTSLGGELYDLEAILAEQSGTPPEELPEAYAATAARLRAAFAAAGEGPFPSGIGPMPAAAIAELRTIECLVHGWDVATAMSRGLAVDDAVAERAIAHSLALMERLPPDRTPFGPRQPVAEDAPAIDRLAGLLGRKVSG